MDIKTCCNKYTINYKNKKIELKIKKVSFFGKGIGLMFRTKNTKNLLFELSKDTKRAIHSYFVFFDFLAIWLDKNNKVIEYKIIEPFELSISPKKEFRKLIEIPINDKNREIIKFFVDNR
ncbi:MAG: DUF192 domain-containing protein [Candidatus Pacearchaeota archaeon]|nr:DUF192 domain-containing protein [Candidatus Pacearchaeota archaeon]